MDVVNEERRKVENNGMHLRNCSAILNKYIYIYIRDRQIFHRNFPQQVIESIQKTDVPIRLKEI
jgi:hypothetical protein